MHKRLFSSTLLAVILLSSTQIFPARAAGWGELNSNTSETLLSIDLYSDTLITVGADGQISWSDDSGEEWHSGDSNTSLTLSEVSMISAEKAIAVGFETTILRTTDSGDDWDVIEPDLTTSAHADLGLRAVNMASSTIGYAIGEQGLALKTTDGGESWDEMTSPNTGYDFNSIATYGTSTLWVTGEAGVMYKSTNGGTSWAEEDSGTNNHLITVEFTDSSHGFAVGENATFIYTTNGGTTWYEESVSEINDSDDIVDVDFINSQDGMITTSGEEILETDDGGESWDDLELSVSGEVIDLLYVSSSERYGVGDDGAIIRYDESSPDAPENLDVSGDNDNVTDTTPKFTWEAASDDETDVDYYEFKMDSGSYKNVGDVTTKTYSTELDNGNHTAYVRAVDSAGNTSSADSVSFTVDADSSSSGAPDIATITPSYALKNETVTFNAMIEDDDGTIASCYLYVDGEQEKSMTVKTDVAYATYKFTSTGSHTMYARCTNDDGETSSGSSRTVKVVSESSYAEAGDIIKIGCEGNVYVNDPCTAVYYYGYDGRRHAFPNETVFKSWFDDFDDLVTLTSSAMSDISLGENVTLKPGESLVQFSDTTVYAISYAGILRPIATGSIAKALYGSDWTDEIVGVNDAFFGNYRVGSMIESSADYSESAVKSASKTIDSTF